MVDKVQLANDIEGPILAAAKTAKVNVFQRWALMQRWRCEDGVPLDAMDDGHEFNLHTSDWATGYITQALFEAIRDAPQTVIDRPF